MPGSHGKGCGCRDEKSIVGESLLPFINTNLINAKNEKVEGSSKKLFRTYSERLDDSNVCTNDDDDKEIIIDIPFISPCEVSNVRVIGGDKGNTPKFLKLYVNNEFIDFNNVGETKETQTIQLVEDFHGALEFPLVVAKFTNVTNLTMYFKDNLGGDCIELFFIELQGKGSNYKRQAVTSNYEVIPNVEDHKTRGDDFIPRFGVD